VEEEREGGDVMNQQSRSRSRSRSRSESRSMSRSRPESKSKSRSRSRSRSRSKSRSRSRSRARSGRNDETRARIRMTKKDLEDLAEEVARKVFEKKEEKEAREKEKAEKTKVWEEGVEFMLCKPCSTYGRSPEVPLDLMKARRGRGGANYGMIGKLTESGEERPSWKVKAAMRDHCDGSLHIWCVRKADEVKTLSKSFEEENKEVGISVLMTFLKNARRGGSAADFINDIDFLHLIPGIPKSQKNNSSTIFFELRDDAFEVVTGSVQELFKSGNITEISVTLDKVTVQHRSFTVLLTFFFYEGSIYCLLNALLKMHKEDYDARGTAAMVVTSLKETLGLNRTLLATKLLHFRCVVILNKF
jgi:hypothetical protein